MKRALVIFTFIGFAGIMLFGFAAMSGHTMDGMDNCIAALNQAVLCSHSSALAMIQLHADLFQKMSRVASFGALLLLIALYAVFDRLDWRRLCSLYIERIIAIRRGLFEISYALHRQPILAWLTLTEKVGPATL